MSTSATQESALALDRSSADESFWDTSSDQLAAESQMSFYQRQTGVQGRLLEVVAQRQNQAVQIGEKLSPLMFDYCISRAAPGEQ